MSDPANTRILVTGGSGFIGRYVVDLLTADGHSPLVTTFDQKKPEGDIAYVDLTLSEQVTDLVQNYRPQVVIHLAGVTGKSDPTGNIYEEVNFRGTVNLLNALEKTGVERVILLGTASEYGNQPIPFREDMPVKPLSHYAVSKANANQFGLDMHTANGFPVTILRVFTAYGHGQPAKMFLSQIITHGLLNKHFKMSDGLQKRDFVFIEDVVSAVRSAITAEKSLGRVVNIAGGKGIRLRDVARKVWEICGADDELLDIGSLPKAGDDIFDTEADISLAAEILNWLPGSGILNETDNFSRLTATINKMRATLRP